MSEENVEVARRSNEAFNRDGVESIGTSGPWPPDIVFDVSKTGIPGLAQQRASRAAGEFRTVCVHNSPIGELLSLSDNKSPIGLIKRLHPEAVLEAPAHDLKGSPPTSPAHCLGPVGAAKRRLDGASETTTAETGSAAGGNRGERA